MALNICLATCGSLCGILICALLVLFLIMAYIVAVLFNQIACFLGIQLRNFLTCEPYRKFFLIKMIK
jgi:hypothetical protein